MATTQKTAQKTAQKTVKDPVCGMDIDPATAAGQSEYQGQTYYFCSAACKQKFDSDPAQYGDKSEGDQDNTG